MTRTIMWSSIILLLLLISWLSAGRQIASLLDPLVPAGTARLPVSPIEYDGGGFVIGGQSMTFGQPSNVRANLRVISDSSNRVILFAGRDVFALGPRRNPADPRGRPKSVVAPDPGDELVFTASESLLGWPTPFEFRILGGPSPWWKRYVYYRLLWEKPSGARLEMAWRYERQYYSASGWTAPTMMWNSQTGLLAVRMTQAR